MEWIGGLIGLGASALTGGVTGLLGVALKLLGGYFAKRQEIEGRRLDQAHELALLDRQAAIRGAETESAARIAEAAAAADLRSASYGFARGGAEIYKWAATAISLTRVVLTVGLVSIAAWMFHLIWTGGFIDAGGRVVLTDADTKGLLHELVFGIIYLTTSAVLWWFGDRPQSIRR